MDGVAERCLRGRVVRHPRQSRNLGCAQVNCSSLKSRDNILAIITDYTGYNQNSQKPMGTQNPRGIMKATLIGGDNFTLMSHPRKCRLREEHQPRAWLDERRRYLRRADGQTSAWVPRPRVRIGYSSPSEGVSGAEGRFSTTIFTLDLEEKLDVPIGLQLQAPANTEAVVQIFMNGYQFCHYLPHIGPQNLFPFTPGVINNRGENSLAISMKALKDAGARLEQVELMAYAKYGSGFNFNQDWSYLPGWKDRKEYV